MTRTNHSCHPLVSNHQYNPNSRKNLHGMSHSHNGDSSPHLNINHHLMDHYRMKFHPSPTIGRHNNRRSIHGAGSGSHCLLLEAWSPSVALAALYSLRWVLAPFFAPLPSSSLLPRCNPTVSQQGSPSTARVR